MSKAFRNQIATLAAIDSFTNMLIDLIKDGSVTTSYPDLETDLKQTLVNIKNSNRLAQIHCKGSVITVKEYKQIEFAIKDACMYFTSEKDKLMDIVGYISFALIGLDSVLSNLKTVKPKLKNQTKINAFEILASYGFLLIQFFDPNLDSIDKYEKADFARRKWEAIFEL